ncbi:hypothetical protein Avbf_04414 [Armadillidium vulgare]|nr:hypothetical protein Avbf_04414 [Armadillidium vulgare]
MKTKYKFGDFAPKKRFSVTSHFKFQTFFAKYLVSNILWLIFILEIMVIKQSSGSCGLEPYILWRSDGRCGPNFPVFRSSIPSECDSRE